MENTTTEILLYTIDEQGNYIGSLVNYPTVYSYGKSLKELQVAIKEILSMEKEAIDEILEGKLESKQLTEIEYEGEVVHNVNILYWEIERLQWLLKNKKDMKRKISSIIGTELENNNVPYDMVDKLIEAIINYKNE